MQSFEWDENKARTNLKKHGIEFADAITVFRDEHAVIELERYVDGEARWRTIGATEGDTMLFVAHTVEVDGMDEIVRIISARKASPRERRRYGKNRS